MFFIVYGLLVVFTFVSFGDYEEKWEYSSIREYLKTTFTFLSTNLFLGLFFYFSEGFFIPRTIFFTSIPISLILILSARVFIRGIKEFNLQQNNNLKIAIVCKEKNLHGIFERLKDYDIKGIFLEDRVPRGRMFKGIPIYYDISFLRNLPIDEVFIDKEISQDFYIKVLDLKPQNSIVRKIDLSFSYFEEFRIEDVIQREKRQINLEIDKDKIYLITGAGGSIGKSIAKELVNLGAKYLKLLDYNEENIHNLYLELLPFQNVKKEFILCDIKDKLLSKIVGEVDIIFHCAANKHVPYVEENKYTAYQTNILGLINTLENFKNKNRQFVFISTDKAVNPQNFMGLTKRIGEIITLSYSQEYDKSIVVRFGNVFGTSGSLIPSVIKQIKMYNKVFLTDKEVKRFFMLPEEAAKLIIKSLEIPSSKISVLDMGEQLKIYDIIQKIIQLVAKNKKIEIQIIGLRKGEKLEEELFFSFEEIIEKKDFIFVIEPKMKISKEEILSSIEQINKHLETCQDFKLIEDYLIQKLEEIIKLRL
ncbi:MAG: SDR family NAD(P)-dependent oxidoreductase [bacterium]